MLWPLSFKLWNNLETAKAARLIFFLQTWEKQKKLSGDVYQL